MARDITDGPMTEDEFVEARKRLQALRQEIREDLAADLGRHPDAFRADGFLGDSGDE